MASETAELYRMIIDALADASFTEHMQKTETQRKAYGAIGEKGQEAFKRTYKVGFTDGFIEAMKLLKEKEGL